VKWHYFADVTLACEDNKGILAHKVLLVSGSGFYRDNNLKMSEGGTSPSAKDKMAHFSEWNVQAQWLARDQGLGSWTTLPRFLSLPLASSSSSFFFSSFVLVLISFTISSLASSRLLFFKRSHLGPPRRTQDTAQPTASWSTAPKTKKGFQIPNANCE